MTLPEALALRAASTPALLAFSIEGRAATYGSLAATAARLASAMAQSGLNRGSHLGMVLPSSLEFVHTFYAAQWLGAVPVPVSPELPPEQIVRRLQAADCRGLVTTSNVAVDLIAASRAGGGPVAGWRSLDISTLMATAEGCQALPFEAPDPDSVAYLQFTSGTSGESRAAIILHRNLAATLRGMHDALGFGPADVIAGSIPLHHNFGLVRFVCAPVFSGCACHLIASASNVGRWLELMSEVEATVTAGPDYLYRAAALRVDPAKVNLGNLRFASNGGEGVQLETIRLFEQRFGVPGTVRPGYGLTETTLTVCSLTPGLPLRSLSGGALACGPALPGTDVVIANDDGGEVSRGEAGEILVRGPSVFAGYYKDPAGSRAVLRDGWLRTGDRGVMDEDGFLYVTGRQRWLIKRGGSTIVPGDVEAAVARTPGVERSAALGVADSQSRRERFVIVAEVERSLAAAASLMLSGLAAAIAGAALRGVGHQPTEIVLVRPGALPLTGSGKVRHGELLEIFNRGEVEQRLSPLARFGPS